MKVRLHTVTSRMDNVRITGIVDSNHAYATVSKTALDKIEADQRETFLAVALAHSAGSTSAQPVEGVVDPEKEIEVSMDQIAEFNQTKTIRPKLRPETPMAPPAPTPPAEDSRPVTGNLRRPRQES